MPAAQTIQRPLRGSRISTFYPIKNLPSLSSLDSAFQLQEYISLLIRLDVHDVDAIVSLPGTSKKDVEAAREKANTESVKEGDKDSDKKGEIQVDRACWIYEQLRRLAQDLSHPLITTLQQECTRATCPEMKAGEWLYLCVAHGNDGAMEQCCAIDYILHTVDSATALLNSPRTFPSRLQIPQTSHRHFSSLARRLGRIFAHAFFSHREVFEQAEAESSLYARFLALTSKFDLVPAEFLVIPSGLYDGDSRERDSFRDVQFSRQKQEELSGLITIAPRHTQLPLGIGKPKSPNFPNPLDSSAAGGTVAEAPILTSTSRSRFGRNRTDTMVFADVDASGVADELAAKARAGEFDVDFELDQPTTAKPPIDNVPAVVENVMDEDHEVMDLEHANSDIEVTLDPEEEILEPWSEGVAIDSTVKIGAEIPDIEIEESVKDEAIAPAATADTIHAIDSATMDEHIQATDSEEADEVEPSVNIIKPDVQASEPERGHTDLPTLNDSIDKHTVTEPAAPPSPISSTMENSTDETSTSSSPPCF